MSLEIERREGMGNSRKLESKNWVEESGWRFSRVGWGGGDMTEDRSAALCPISANSLLVLRHAFV